MDEKMSPDSIEKHSRFWKTEPKTAAYLGYDDLAEFRAFRFHPVVLKWYLVYAKRSSEVTKKMNKVRKLLQTEKHDMVMERIYNQEECLRVWIYVVSLSGYVTGTSARDSA